MSTPTWGLDPKSRRITVYYEGTSTIREGMPLCYNYDTTDNWLGVASIDFTSTASTITESGTTAEGSQNEGKFIRVEDPVTANLQWLAGFVAGADHDGETGPKALDIYVPNGAIVPVRTDKDCSIGDSIGIEDGEVVLTAVTGDGDPVPCAHVMETVDRSSVSGLVLAKVFATGQQVTATNAYFAPIRGRTTSRNYGVKIDGDNFFVGTTAAQSYLLELSGDKAADYDTTGDGYSAYLHISGSNYAQNDTNYTYRGINCGVSNRSGGTLGSIYGANVSISLKSGSGNITNGIACQIDAQDLTAGTKTAFGGLDVAINREGTAATEEFGMRLRTRGTINTAMNTVFRIDKDATDHGFVNLFNIETDAVDVISASGDLTFTTSDILIPVVYNANTYYFVCTDNT